MNGTDVQIRKAFECVERRWVAEMESAPLRTHVFSPETDRRVLEAFPQIRTRASVRRTAGLLGFAAVLAMMGSVLMIFAVLSLVRPQERPDVPPEDPPMVDSPVVTPPADGADWKQKFDIRNGTLCSYLGTDTTVRIPEEVSDVAPDAFEETEVTTVFLPINFDPDKLASLHFTNPEIRILLDRGNGCAVTPEGIRFQDDLKTLYSYPADLELSGYTIPEGTVTVSANAFNGNPYLTSVVCPESLKAIQNGAFRNCTALRSISLNNDLQWIGSAVFKNSGLREIVLPARLKLMGSETFSGCTELESVEILSPFIRQVESKQFYGCEKLERVLLPDSIAQIMESAFSGCGSLRSIRLPEDLGTIDDYAFANCGLTSILLPQYVRSLSNVAFSGCNDLYSITLEGGADQLNLLKVRIYSYSEQLPPFTDKNGNLLEKGN